MKKYYLAPLLLTVAMVIGACGSTPKTTRLLDQTRSEYRVAQSHPDVAAYSALEMRQASEAMEQANASANYGDGDGKIDHLAYLAKQRIALAREVMKQKSAEVAIVAGRHQRDQMQQGQRAKESKMATLSAEKSLQAAKGDAEQAKFETELAQDDAIAAQRKTQQVQARAAQLQTQLAELGAKKTERGIVITLGDVLFGTDVARLNPDGLRTAQKLARALQQDPNRTVRVEGFTDSTGTASHNQDLSQRRASAVQRALQEMGVARERVTARGYGHTNPVAANDTAPNRQLNRRVEIVLSDDTGRITAR